MKSDLRSGKVYLVGAGPGDPRLITLRGLECLQQAEVVIFDYLVNEKILEYAPKTAERIPLGHHGRGGGMSAESVIKTMVAEAKQGKTVVRLKNGDPAVFGRLAEEMAALHEAAIPLEIVPGVTAGLAAAGYAEIPVTHGWKASAVALVTGHERADKSAPGLDYAALARFPGTLIFYMGVSSAAHWSAALLNEGKSPKTPVAIMRRCSLPDQEIAFCTLETVVEKLSTCSIHPPAVILVGDVIDFTHGEKAKEKEH
jgi:uroporphyrinogen III methyltransferase / synthase